MRTKSPGTLRNINAMKEGMRWLWTAVLSGTLVSAGLGQTVSDFKTLITDGGELRLLRQGQPTMKLRFGLFYDNWKELRANDVGPNTDGTWSSQGSLGSGVMNIRSSVNVVGNTARLTIQATPTRSIQADSAHINVRFDEAFWSGSQFTAGTSFSTILPRRLDETFSVYGKKSHQFVISNPGGLDLTMTLPSTLDYVFRDSRVYSVGFELRAGNWKGAWGANSTKTFVIDLTPSVAMPIGPNQPITVGPNSDWIPVDHKITITPGSVLDWSTPNPQPAGSKGWIKVDANGHFYAEQEPTKRIKFFGTNLSGSACFLPPEYTDKLVDELWRMGYNAVRFHHIDDTLTSGTTANSTTLNPLYVDRFHYLVEKCRQRGIYMSLDLFSYRTTRRDEIIPGQINLLEYKMLLLVDPVARNNWKTYSLNLLNTVSPYTGRKLKDEPAMSFIQLLNEQVPHSYPKGSLRPEIFQKIEAATGRTWSVSQPEDVRFCNQLVTNQYDWMKGVMDAAGVKALLSLHNVGYENAYSGIRSRVDYQDAHVYYAHPIWLGTPWSMPASQPSTPLIKDMNFLGVIAGVRIHKKPFMIGEHDGAAPSPYRGEYGLTMGTLAAVQNWDALYRFGYTDRIQYMESVLPTQYFITVSDPAAVATERALKALFHRGDLTVNDEPKVVHVNLSTAAFEDNRNIPLVKNGTLLTPVASSNSTGSPSYETPILDGISARPDGSVIADLFQQTIRINTPKTVGVVGNPGPVHTAGRLQVQLGDARASVWISSHDGQPLANSRRMLVAHVTEVQNAGTTWSGDERSVVTNMGGLPHIARNGSAMISIALQNPSTARVYRLDMSGKRIAAVPTVKSLSAVQFTATTRNPINGQATIFYEIVR